MVDQPDARKRERYKGYLESELDAAAMYKAMAAVEKDPSRAAIFERLVEAELRHASNWAEKLGLDASSLELPKPGLRNRAYRAAAKMFGTERIIPWLVRGEAKEIQVYAADPEAHEIVKEERQHARTLRGMVNPGDPLAPIRGEGEHRMGGGSGSLRAAVLGVNDGLVSNFSLVMGVAGGTNNADFVLLAGIAGLLAGSFSMAAGEYVSMRSQRDLYEYQIEVEAAELEEWPEEEEQELVLIYRAKGLSQEESETVAKRIMSRSAIALETMAREELGLDPSQLGSPWGAALSSFIAFVSGAIVPIFPYLIDAGDLSFILSGVLSAAALVIVGGALAALTSKSALWGATRMLLAGGAAAAVTCGIGNLIQVYPNG